MMISRSRSKLGHWGQKLGHQAKSKETLVNTPEVTSHFWSNHESCSKCLYWWFLCQVWNWVTQGQKLGHWTKSKKNFMNTWGHIFEAIVMNQNFVLMISRSNLNWVTRSQNRSAGQIKGKPYWHSRGHIFEVIIMNVAQNICLDGF